MPSRVSAAEGSLAGIREGSDVDHPCYKSCIESETDRYGDVREGAESSCEDFCSGYESDLELAHEARPVIAEKEPLAMTKPSRVSAVEGSLAGIREGSDVDHPCYKSCIESETDRYGDVREGAESSCADFCSGYESDLELAHEAQPVIAEK